MADWIGYAPLLVGPRRRNASIATVPCWVTSAEVEVDDAARNRQKELQDYIMAAPDADSILSTIRELDGQIVISTALHRLGKVSSAAALAQDPRFEMLLKRFQAKLAFFGARQIANSLHGLGALQYRVKGDWTQMVSIQTQRKAREFEPQHVSNTLWAYARMLMKEPLMLRALVRRAVEDIGRFCPLDISICTWAMATLKHRDQDWLRAVVRVRCEFADFSPQNMANFVWALATLGFRNDNMVLAVGREASLKISDFTPQELSNFTWALATMDLCDNLFLRAVAEEVERRADELHAWDPQSLSNMMWAFATLAVKDDPLFALLVDASVARIADHDTQNLANSSWAAAMVSFRSQRWLACVAEAAVTKMRDCPTLHMAQMAFAFCRFVYRGDEYQFLRALFEETLRRVEEFPMQSLFDVHDCLISLNYLPKDGSPNQISLRLSSSLDDLVGCLDFFATSSAKRKPTSEQIDTYRRVVIEHDIVTLGWSWTEEFLKRFGLLCPDADPFVADAKRQIQNWRAEAATKDPTSRSVFHRAHCAWQLGTQDTAGCGECLADGVFESGVPTDGGPDQYGLIVCRLRHPREGDAEVQALCAAMRTSVFRNGKIPQGIRLNLHLSDLPCVSCLGATLQFHRRFPGVLRVSFDRGRKVPHDVPPCPRPPPPPSKRGNSQPYAPPKPLPRTRGEAGTECSIVDRSMLRKEGPNVNTTLSFYRGSSGPRRADGAGAGGQESVPHKLVSCIQGSKQQTYYFSSGPDFYGDYELKGEQCE